MWSESWCGLATRPQGDVEDGYQCPCYCTYLPDSLLSTMSLSFHSWSFTPLQQQNMLGSWQANNKQYKRQQGQDFQVQGFSKMWYVHIEKQLLLSNIQCKIQESGILWYCKERSPNKDISETGAPWHQLHTAPLCQLSIVRRPEPVILVTQYMHQCFVFY